MARDGYPLIKLKYSRNMKVVFGLRLLLLCSMITVMIVFFSSNKSPSYLLAATYGWIQSSWAGGADSVTIAVHTSNQTGWTKFSATSSPYMAAGSSVSLSTTSESLVDTSTSDFSAGTLTDTAAQSGSAVMLKQDGASCSAASQCVSGTCSSNICGGP